MVPTILSNSTARVKYVVDTVGTSCIYLNGIHLNTTESNSNDHLLLYDNIMFSTLVQKYQDNRVIYLYRSKE